MIEIPANSPIQRWMDKWIVNPLSFDPPRRLPRVFGIVLVNKSFTGDEDQVWNVIQFARPAREGDCLWRNGLLSFYLHLPFNAALSVRLPTRYKGYWWGHTFQFHIGWKPFNGVFSAALRVQNDDHDDYNQPGVGNVVRARGLMEGKV